MLIKLQEIIRIKNSIIRFFARYLETINLLEENEGKEQKQDEKDRKLIIHELIQDNQIIKRNEFHKITNIYQILNMVFEEL